MANKPVPAVLLALPEYGVSEARFGKTDKILKFPVARVFDDQGALTGWKLVTDDSVVPEGVLFVGKDGSSFVADTTIYPENIKGMMVFHGTKQKVGDEYADLDDVADCMEAAREMHERLAQGKFYAERQGFAGISILMRAIMKVFGIDEAAAREFLKPLSVKEKQALRTSDELKDAIEEIEKERGKGVDTKSILSKLPGRQAPEAQAA